MVVLWQQWEPTTHELVKIMFNYPLYFSGTHIDPVCVRVSLKLYRRWVIPAETNSELSTPLLKRLTLFTFLSAGRCYLYTKTKTGLLDCASGHHDLFSCFSVSPSSHSSSRKQTDTKKLSAVDAENLRLIAEKFRVAIPAKDEEHYLHLLNSLDASVQLTEPLPPYTDPHLLLDPETLPRTYTKLGGLSNLHLNPMTTILEENKILLEVMAGYGGINPECIFLTLLRENVTNYYVLLQASEGLQVSGLSEDVKLVIHAAIAQFKSISADVQEVSILIYLIRPSTQTVVTLPVIGSYWLQNRVPPYLNHTMLDVRSPVFNQKYANTMAAKAITLVQQLQEAYGEDSKGLDVLLAPVNPKAGSKHPENGKNVAEKMYPAIRATLNTCQFNITGRKNPTMRKNILFLTWVDLGLSMPACWGKVPDGLDTPLVSMQMVVKRRWEDKVLTSGMAGSTKGCLIFNRLGNWKDSHFGFCHRYFIFSTNREVQQVQTTLVMPRVM
ncbi:uncharacterized protein BDR25DRAFT_355617 [Lindgomyces ingoldianus]|uniref:Uncharacterized protein n=1 Tax=Lindgomyces ingoldianus TaxID=673940 RepID=A0ACB6QU26_9PLEO|nr:uncharacterized protein BDR25DRAFT_355617 [Lindgomyces ingoldianus]KAF2470524.1 hypothetical protein BDR25DRAFT_355617 [Lindgomyces ingoldianus]